MNRKPRIQPGMVLPNLEFFEPTEYGMEWLVNHLRNKEPLFEVGCGTGKLAASLFDNGVKLIPIDVAFRENPHITVMVMDAMDFTFPEGSWILVCRPCAGLVPDLLKHAEKCGCAGLLYIGKEDNVERDLGEVKHTMLPYDLDEDGLGAEEEKGWEVRFRRAKRKDGIKTCIIMDPMGSSMQTPEEEADQLQESYEELIGRHLNVQMARGPHQIEVGTELVMFDYGGMMPGCESLVEDQSRELLRWAQDHPSALVIVVSSFTFDHFVKRELDEMFPDGIHNVVHEGFAGDTEGVIPEWWTASLKPIGSK